MSLYRDLFKEVLEGPWETAGLDVQFRFSANILYLQCSTSQEDWKANFDFPAVPYRDSPVKWKAHRGFINAWKSARDAILPHLLTIKDPLIVGYSHGAALSVLAHEDVRFNSRDPEVRVKTVAFGCPRVVWGSYGIDHRWEGLTRVAVSGDLVAHLPPALFGYRHVGYSHILGPKKFPWWTHHTPTEYLSYLS